MKILLYSTNFYPELTGTGKYNGEMVEWLADKGHQVRVITAVPYYPAWRVSPPYVSWRFYHEKVTHRLTIWRCPLWIPQKLSGLRRLAHLASFALSSFGVVLLQAFWRPDLIIVVEPPLFLAPGGLLLAWLVKRRALLHIQDLEVDAAFSLGLLPGKNFLKSLAYAVEKWLMGHFDFVSTISPQMIERLVRKGVQREKTILFPNWVDTRQIFPLPRPSLLRQELNIKEDDVVILYSGNMGEKQGLEILLEVAARLGTYRQLKFVLCGDGAARIRLQGQAAKRQLSNVIFIPLQPTQRLNELLNLADIHVVIQKGQASDLVMPSKMTGILASGRPVVATAFCQTALSDVIEASEAGLLVPPEDADKLVEAILDLASDPDRRKKMGQNGRRYAEKFLEKEVILHSVFSYLSDRIHETARG